MSLLVLLVLTSLVVGALPAWPHSRGWGYGPSASLGVVLAMVVALLLQKHV